MPGKHFRFFNIGHAHRIGGQRGDQIRLLPMPSGGFYVC
jgi:hypothetical protein